MDNIVLEALMERRSRRKYDNEPVANDLIESIVNAALISPSSLNKQNWHLTVIQDKKFISDLEKDTVAEISKKGPKEIVDKLNSRKNPIFYNAPAVFIISIPSEDHLVDVGIMAQSIAIAAYSLDLGSVILGMPQFAFMGENASEWRKKLEFPRGFNYGIAIAVGNATDDPKDREPNIDKISYIK